MVRLGSLKGYQEIEDECRADEREGIASWTGSRGIRGGGIEIYPVYLLCASGPSVDLSYLREKYGKWVVRIKSPIRLREQLSIATPVNTNMELWKTVELEKVSYTIDEPITWMTHDAPKAFKLSYTQKPQRYQADCEYRYVIRAKAAGGSAPRYLDYDLGGPVSYVEVL